MKRNIKIAVAVVTILSSLYSCENQMVSFPDYPYTSSYFPYQFPVRTLILGDYIFDNTNDNAHKFVISATMGGAYENNKDITIAFEVDNSLTDNLYQGTTKMLALPSSYYTLSNPSQIIIPKGSYAGGVEVQLNDNFFNDPKSVGPNGINYVVPLKMISSTTDSVLRGKSENQSADRRIVSQWIFAPQDFTLFAINYVNQYHGKYLRRGASTVTSNGTVIETNIYRNQYVERDDVVDVNTASLITVTYKYRVVRKTASPGDFTMLITFDASGNGTITKDASSTFNVSGTAKFAKNAEKWGNKPRHAIYLDYLVSEGTNLHHALDTLVFRDKAIKLQEFLPVVIP